MPVIVQDDDLFDVHVDPLFASSAALDDRKYSVPPRALLKSRPDGDCAGQMREAGGPGRRRWCRTG